MKLYVVRRVDRDGKKEYLSTYIVSDGSRRDLEICWSDSQGEALRMRRDIAKMAASHQGMGSKVVRVMPAGRKVRVFGCPHCGEKPSKEDAEMFVRFGFYACPECTRQGCDSCMPSGRGCLCPECEESAAG